jgi:hypothetical protein
MSREHLPNRRAHESRELLFRGQRFAVGIGRNGAGAPLEVFLNARKTGSEYDALARDAGILLSIALQSGADLSTIARALTRDQNGAPGSLLSALLDNLEGAGT